MLGRLNQNGAESGTDAVPSSVADAALLAKRQDLSHAGISAKRVKPVVLPLGK
jgi:hypothetical protein